MEAHWKTVYYDPKRKVCIVKVGASRLELSEPLFLVGNRDVAHDLSGVVLLSASGEPLLQVFQTKKQAKRALQVLEAATSRMVPKAVTFQDVAVVFSSALSSGALLPESQVVLWDERGQGKQVAVAYARDVLDGMAQLIQRERLGLLPDPEGAVTHVGELPLLSPESLLLIPTLRLDPEHGGIRLSFPVFEFTMHGGLWLAMTAIGLHEGVMDKERIPFRWFLAFETSEACNQHMILPKLDFMPRFVSIIDAIAWMSERDVSFEPSMTPMAILVRSDGSSQPIHGDIFLHLLRASQTTEIRCMQRDQVAVAQVVLEGGRVTKFSLTPREVFAPSHDG